MVVSLKTVARLLGPAILFTGIIAMIPATVAVVNSTPGAFGFFSVTGLSVAIFYLLRIYSRGHKLTITLREMFLFTASLWFSITMLSAIPFWIMLDDISYCESLFEAASGLSTTGATAINHLNIRPPSILLWRSMLQYLGGLGFVVIAVAVLPNVASGGMNIFKTESTSFDISAKLTPHIKTMAFYFLALYLFLLIACTICYMLGGLDFFLAITSALSTVSTGGMMILDESMTFMPPAVHYTAIVFMIIGSLPFLLILAAISGNLSLLYKDQQVRAFIKIIAVCTAIVTATLFFQNDYDFEKAFRVALFNIVSVISTSGFALEDFASWNETASFVFFIILAIGGCSSSTSGGIKVFRLVVAMSMFKAQLFKSLHPHSVSMPRFNSNIVGSDTLRSIITYFVAYILALLISSFAATSLGLTLSDSFSASMTCLSNVGPAMGPTLTPAGNFAGLSDPLYLIFAFDMILGRLEIIPVILCMTSIFWRK